MKPTYIIENALNVKKLFGHKKGRNLPSLILSSPPYFDVLNYESNPDQIGYGQKYTTYLDDVVSVFQQCYDVSTTDASFWLVVDDFRKDGTFYNLPFDIVNGFKKNKSWQLKEVIIWDKAKNLPWNANGRFKNQFEYILYFTKGVKTKFHIDRVREITDLKKWWVKYPERYNSIGKAPSNIWSYTNPIRGWGNNCQNHLCPFPFPLVEKILSISSDENDLILDPFAGSGTVLATASFMNRRAIGIDINPSYKSLFDKEVFPGSKKYWAKRHKELEVNKAAIKDFKKINSKLRKHKIFNQLSLHINKISNSQFLYFLMDTRQTGVFDMYVVENGVSPKMNWKESEELKNLVHQAKISPNIEIIKIEKLNEKLKNKDFFCYNFKNFYNYKVKTKFEKIVANHDRYDFIYSNIDLKIKNIV